MNHTWNISIQQIQIFLKAVELKNFTQVARYFNFTPSTVSKNISILEDELDIQLFIRKPHELSTTPAAEYLASEWKRFVGSVDNTIQKAKDMESNAQRTITIGFVDSSDTMDQVITKCVRDFSKEFPNTQILVEKHDLHRAVELLHMGMLDLVTTSEMELPYIESHNLHWEKAFDSQVAIYVPQENPLFHRDSLSLEDLRDESFVSLNPTMNPSYEPWLNDICMKHGFSPAIVASYRTIRSLLFSLTLNPYVFVGETITSDWSTENLKMFILPEKTFSLLAWKDNESEVVLRLKDALLLRYSKEIQTTNPVMK